MAWAIFANTDSQSCMLPCSCKCQVISGIQYHNNTIRVSPEITLEFAKTKQNHLGILLFLFS